MSFENLGLSDELLRAVQKQGYSVPTPIQKKAIPPILNNQDIMGCAQTGTGKTASFTLPLLQRLMRAKKNAGGRRHIRALILTPTRELAAQVCKSVETYGKHLPLRCTVVFGGVSMGTQVRKFRSGVDILIATPGRLLDHVGRGTVDLSKVDVLILDEADRMLDMGFIPDVKKIIASLPKNRQNLLFSATFPKEIKRLAVGFLRNPIIIEVAPQHTASELVKQVVHHVDRRRKKELLSHIINTRKWRRVLVFTRTKIGANRLAEKLDKNGISATAIHGNKSQAARTKALDQFKRENVRVLVATDIAARGLDIQQLPHVVNYDLPNIPEDYVHRIGRTGRAGNEGEALSLVSVDELAFLKSIEKLLKRSIPKISLEGFKVDPSIKAEPIQRRGRGARKGSSNSSGRRHGHSNREGGDNRDSPFSKKGRQGNRRPKSPWGARSDSQKSGKRFGRSGSNSHYAKKAVRR